MEYKGNDIQSLSSTINKIKDTLSLNDIVQIDFKSLEDELLFLSSFRFNGNEIQTIHSSGLLPKLNFHLLHFSVEMQIEILVFFLHMVKSNELFSLLLIESGFFINLSVLWDQLRHNTGNLLIKLAKNRLIAQRIILFFDGQSFTDINFYSDEAKQVTIKLLFTVLKMDPFSSENLFIQSIRQILTADPSLSINIGFGIIEAAKGLEICQDLFNWYLSDEIKELWFFENDQDLKTLCQFIECIITHVLKSEASNSSTLISLVKNGFDLLSFNQKELVCEFINQFQLYENDHFVEVFALHIEGFFDLSNGLEICLKYSKMLLNLPSMSAFVYKSREHFHNIYLAIHAKNQFPNFIPKLIPLELLLSSILETSDLPNHNLIIYEMISFSEDQAVDFQELFEQHEIMAAFLTRFNEDNSHENEVNTFQNTMKVLYNFNL